MVTTNEQENMVTWCLRRKVTGYDVVLNRIFPVPSIGKGEAK